MAYIVAHARQKGHPMASGHKHARGGIVFGNWMLAPMDANNWELCHWHVPKAAGRHKGGTEPKWNRLGRFYQYNTIQNALLYAADCELGERAREQAHTIFEALDEYRAIVDTMRADLVSAMGGQA